MLAILALYRIDTTTERIEVTIGLTVALGLFLTFFTSANVKEVCAATATFAAVEVVFIGLLMGAEFEIEFDAGRGSLVCAVVFEVERGEGVVGERDCSGLSD